MNPEDIPESITAQVYGVPLLTNPARKTTHILTRSDAAEVLAHFWPAIERHIREQVAADIDAVRAKWEGFRDVPRDKLEALRFVASMVRISTRGEQP